MFDQNERKMVDALEDGRIVRVSEEYAKREGLLIIRKPEPSAIDSPSKQKEMKLTPRLRGERKAYFDIEKYRRPWHDKNEILSSLVDNFHWEISSKRKGLNLNRKQMAQEINCPEEDLKLIENGTLPHNDYILINKIENYLKINLRRDKISSSSAEFPNKIYSSHKPKWVDNLNKSKPETKAEELVSDEIEIADDSSEEEEEHN